MNLLNLFSKQRFNSQHTIAVVDKTKDNKFVFNSLWTNQVKWKSEHNRKLIIIMIEFVTMQTLTS